MQYGELVDYFVTAEKIPTHRMDTPANVTVITAADIEANHYKNLDEVLNHVNGVVATNYVQLHGTRRILILVDGRRITTTQNALSTAEKSSIAGIPSLKMVERIEIVKGGYSALYGSDAIGGVINIITKKGTKNETTLDFSADSWNSQNYEITNQGTAGNFSWFVTGTLNRRDYRKELNYYDVSSWRDRSPRYIKEVRKWDNTNQDAASIRLDNKFDDSSSLTLQLLHKSYQKNSLYNNVGVFYNFKEDTNTPGRLVYFHNYFSRDYGTDDPNFWSAEFNKTKFQGLEYQNGWELGKHKLIAGLEWRQNDVDTSRGGITYNGKNHEESAYIQDTYSFDKWTFVPGVRLDHTKAIGNHWSPKVAVNYRPQDNTKFFATWGKVFVAPTELQLYSQADPNYMFLGYNFLMYGNPNLKAETGYTAMIGIEHDFDENTGITANYFKNHLNDIVGLTSDTDAEENTITRSFANDETNKNHGIEINFRQKLSDKWSYNLGYNHTSGRRIVYYNQYVFDDPYAYPPTGYNVGLHYNCGAWKANLYAIAAEGFDFSWTPSKFVIFDFNLSYDINDFATCYFRTTNFTNQDYGLMLFGDLSSPARYFLAGAQFKF